MIPNPPSRRITIKRNALNNSQSAFAAPRAASFKNGAYFMIPNPQETQDSKYGSDNTMRNLAQDSKANS